MAHAYNPSYSGGKDQEDYGSQKYPTHERAGEVVEHLPSKCEALNSNPSTALCTMLSLLLHSFLPFYWHKDY
jgi:hypothetical protein